LGVVAAARVGSGSDRAALTRPLRLVDGPARDPPTQIDAKIKVAPLRRLVLPLHELRRTLLDLGR
jgi:hypothetical protein